LKILHLTLKKKWFDLIESGLKTEEYREIKPYWTKRFENKKFDRVIFKNGYSANAPIMEFTLTNILVGLGDPEYGAPENDFVYVLYLGDRIR